MESPKKRILFSAEAANALLPQISPLMLRIQTLVGSLDDHRRTAADRLKRSRTNGHKPEPAGEDPLIEISKLTADIESLGCVIADLPEGVVAFPAERDGTHGRYEWKVGEPRVSEFKPR